MDTSINNTCKGPLVARAGKRGQFRELPVRRVVGAASKCACITDSGLSATAFASPAESVTRAASAGHISSDRTYLEVGAGNLRNTIFVQREFAPKKVVVIERQSVVERFSAAYRVFERNGGRLVHSLPKGQFDVIVMTYVLETICPAVERQRLLGEIADRMHLKSTLIISARGYGGVRGRLYTRCALSDGWKSPRGAFVRAYSIPELEEMLAQHSIQFSPLKNYRVANPENIHGIGKIRND
jgi:hypothetical protein